MCKKNHFQWIFSFSARKHHKEKGYHHRGRCSELAKTLGAACDVQEDCSNINCNNTFEGQPVFLSVNINKCENPKSLEVRVRVLQLGLDWSNTFVSGDIITVPGFPFTREGIVSAEVYVKVELDESDDSKLKMKVGNN